MLIKALKHANNQQLCQLNRWISATDYDLSEKITAVTILYDQIGVKALCDIKMMEYSDRAMKSLAAVKVTGEKKKELEKLVEELMHREV